MPVESADTIALLNLALFDFDVTITTIPTYPEFLRFAVGRSILQARQAIAPAVAALAAETSGERLAEPLHAAVTSLEQAQDSQID